MASATPGLRVRALFVARRIETRDLRHPLAISHAPLTLRFVDPPGWVVVFRFGAVAFAGLDESREREVLASLTPYLREPVPEPASEEAELRLAPDRADGVDADGLLSVRELSDDRIQVVANVVAKSALLTHYEGRIAAVFDRVEGFASQLRRGKVPARSQELLRELGDALFVQTQMVGWAEVAEKPEIVWEERDLDVLYERLSAEYELRDRDVALTRKLTLVSNVAGTYLDLHQSRQSIRLEWYIVVLIVVEIVILVYEIVVL